MAPDSAHGAAILAARQNYEAAVAATERLAEELLVTTRRLGEAIARRDAALTTLLRLEAGER